MSAQSGQRQAVVLHPLWRRFARNGSVTVGLMILPPFAALYWLTAPTGGWPWIALIHAVTVSVITLGAIGARSARITIDERGIRERGYFGRLIATPMSEIDSVLVVRVLAGSSQTTATQLFVLDAGGRTRLRMRGQFWSAEAIATVERVLDVPVQRIPAPLTRRELRLAFRSNLSAYERHPHLVFSTLAAVSAAVATPVFVTINRLL
jgi:hypothetical protein